MPLHGKNTGIVIDGYDITRWCHEVSGDHTIDVAESTGFDSPEGAKEYVPGHNDTTFAWSGREQGQIDNFRSRFGGIALLDAGVPFIVAIAGGFHAGRIAEMGKVLETSINISAPVADVVSASGDLQADGPVDVGYVLTTKDPYATTGAVNGASVPLGAASAGSRIFYHCVQNSRNGLVTVKVQESVNGTTWVDYDTHQFAAGGVGAVIHDLPTTGLDSFVRVVVTLAGTTGTATLRVAIARKA
jgi:hypothetical protein